MECQVVEQFIVGDWMYGLVPFVAIVAVAYLSRKVKDHPKVTPAYKIKGSDGRVSKH